MISTIFGNDVHITCVLSTRIPVLKDYLASLHFNAVRRILYIFFFWTSIIDKVTMIPLVIKKQ